MTDIKYITDLKKSDLAKMIAAGNMREGSGIKIRQDETGYIIELDKDVIVDIIWCYIQARAAPPCVNASGIMDIRGKIRLDPNTYS